MDRKYLLLLALVLIVGYVVYTQFLMQQFPQENFDGQDVVGYRNSISLKDQSYVPNSSPAPVGRPSVTDIPQIQEKAQDFLSGISQQLTASDLLPQDTSSTWAQCNPSGAGTLEGKNFLDAGWHVGINTVGQTLRNANLQLRSEPPNPQVVVSPFNQTTIMPDTNRRYFEVGQC